MMNNWRNCYFLIIFLVIFSFISMQGMESETPPEPLYKLALQTALIARPDLFDRKMIVTLSMLSKYCQLLIVNTARFRKRYNDDCRALVLLSAEERKQQFMDGQPHLKLIPNLVWNENGTICAQASCGTKLKFALYTANRLNRPCGRIKEVMLERRHILDTTFHGNYKVWECFYNVLPHQPRAFFYDNKNIYFHAYGGMEVDGKMKGHVLEYRLASSADPDALICLTNIDNQLVPLTTFLEFPLLLKAFLQSSQWRITSQIGVLYSGSKPYDFKSVAQKVFILEGVQIPQNFDTREQYFSYAPTYNSFGELPKRIRNAILTRYAEQNQTIVKVEKEKKGLLSCFGK